MRALLALLLLATTATAQAQTFKPLCRSAGGKVDQCVGTLANAMAPTAPTMSGANISAGTIPIAALVASSLTVTAGTGLLGGGAVSLGGSTALSVAYGTTAGTAAQGNDARLSPAPSAAGRTLYDTGAAWAALAAGSANALYQANGAAAPSWTSAPTVSGANITAGTIGYGSLATSATDRMLVNPALANNLVPVGNGTNWTAVGTSSAGYLLTAGVTTPVWSNSLSGIILNASLNTVSNIATSMLASGFNLAATQGGTGQTSYTVGDLLYASTTTALSKLAASTSGYVLTANGAGVAPSYQAPATNSTVSATLASTTWTSTTFVDSGRSITLPSAGKWLITFRVRNYCQVSSGAPGVNSFQLYDNTAAATVPESTAFGAADYIGGGSGFGTTTTWSVIYDVGSGRIIRLYVKRLAGPTYAASGTGMASDTTEGESTGQAVLLRP